ncbi:MAG TPA: GNAT family N-acetyltransferase [Candidatus Dormibacteraeota bacterium]|nr:GNAT family N-acetyltransferase [Candidatus Dormibacteraeota bacterium]
MEEENCSAGTAFQPAAGPAAVDQVRRFLLAQGWAGLQLGDYLRRVAAERVRPEEVLWWVPGRAGEARAAAILHEDRLGLLAPFPDEQKAARVLLDRNRAQLERISAFEGQVDTSGLDEFDFYRRDLAVAEELLAPAGDLPATRPSRAEDVEQLHLIYGAVGWMREASPTVWRQRLQQEPCWVAELEGQVVAAARWTMSFGSWVEIGGVATHTRFRRRGAGSAVTLAATEAALAEGRHAVLRFGDPALASLYHPLGFQPVGRERVFHRRS